MPSFLPRKRGALYSGCYCIQFNLIVFSLQSPFLEKFFQYLTMQRYHFDHIVFKIFISPVLTFGMLFAEFNLADVNTDFFSSYNDSTATSGTIFRPEITQIFAAKRCQ